MKLVEYHCQQNKIVLREWERENLDLPFPVNFKVNFTTVILLYLFTNFRELIISGDTQHNYHLLQKFIRVEKRKGHSTYEQYFQGTVFR